MQKIGVGVILKTEELIKELFREHAIDLNNAYLNAEDALSVSVGVKYKPNVKTGAIDIDVTMSFTAEKITDSRKDSVVEGQETLFKGLQDGTTKITVDGKDIMEKE